MFLFAPLQCEVNFNNDRNLTYSCVYVPTVEGEHRVIVKFAGKEIPKSPFRVHIDAMPGTSPEATGYVVQRHVREFEQRAQWGGNASNRVAIVFCDLSPSTEDPPFRMTPRLNLCD